MPITRQHRAWWRQNQRALKRDAAHLARELFGALTVFAVPLILVLIITAYK